MSVNLKNTGNVPLSSVHLILTTADPNISCITKGTIDLPTPLPVGATFDTATLGATFDPSCPQPPPAVGAGQFEYVVSPGARSLNPASPYTARFVLTVVSKEAVGTKSAVNLDTHLGLNLPQGTPPALELGPDGQPNPPDDGQLAES